MDYIDRVLAEEDRKNYECENAIAFYCSWCGRPVYHGEEYYTDGDENICEDCMDRYERRIA